MYNYNKYTGSFFGIHPLNNGGDYWDNPNDESFSNNMGHIVTSNFYTEFKLPFNLKFRSALNIDNYYNRNMSYDSAVHGSDQLAPYGVTVKTNGGYAERYDLTQRSTTWKQRPVGRMEDRRQTLLQRPSWPGMVSMGQPL